MNFSIPSSYISDIENYILSDTKNYLILASSPYEADMLTKELSFFTKHDVQYFPDREILPFDQFSSDKNVLLNRSKFLKYCTIISHSQIHVHSCLFKSLFVQNVDRVLT